MQHQSKITCLILLCFVFTSTLFASSIFNIQESKQLDSLLGRIELSTQLGLENSIKAYNNALKSENVDFITIYKGLAIAHAALGQPAESYDYTVRYINNSLDFAILENDAYSFIRDSEEFKQLQNKYLFKINFLALIFCYASLIGLFLIVVLAFNKKADKTSNWLIIGFVAIHVLFIFEYVLYMTNLQYRIPHTYLVSSSFALLYGPLLYFYFKRVVHGYILKRRDLLHAIPTVMVLAILAPIYSLSSSEKIAVMLGISEYYKYQWLTVFIPKLLSLSIYGILIGKLHFSKKVNTAISSFNNPLIIKWENNIYKIHVVFIISYLIYGVSISGILGISPSYIYNSQVAAMAVMILYIAYMAYIQPQLFNKETFVHVEGELGFTKYEKSGLTEALSNELKESLYYLLLKEKVFKDNNICLEKLSEKLNTTRHNTSQIINEHFNMNFFELINKFRVEEAINLLRADVYKNLNIIDIAYEVGFNNKVTFNKAFKKETSLTPSEFIQTRSNRNNQVNWR